MALNAFCDMETGRAFTTAEYPGGQLAADSPSSFRRFYDAPLVW